MSLRESVSIELGGRTWRLRYDFNAFVALEEELKIPISEIGNILSGSVRLKDLRAILWAGLIHEDASLTPAKVGEMVGDIGRLADFAESVRVALEASFPEVPKAGAASGASKNRRSPRP